LLNLLRKINNNKKDFEHIRNISAMFFVLYLAAFGLMIFPHFSADTFSIHAGGYKHLLALGRVAAYIFNLLFIFMDMYKMSWFTSLLSMIFLTISSVIIYYKISQTLCKKSLITAGAVAILFCNPFMADVFQFAEVCHTITLGVLFSSTALIPIKRDMPLKNFLISIILLFTALNFYQAVLGYYVSVSLVLIYLYNRNLTWRGVRDSLKIICAAGIASIACVIELRLLQNTGIIYIASRTSPVTLEILIKNLQSLYKIIIGIVLPAAKITYLKYIFPIFWALIYGIFIYSMLKKRVIFQNYIYSALIIIISLAAVFAPHVLTSPIWLSQRSVISFWSILAIPLLCMENLLGTNLKKAVLSITIFILCFNTAAINFMEVSLLTTNKIEQEISYLVQSRINEYENQTGNEIKTIVFRNDNRPTWSYKSAGYSAYDFAIRTYTTSWGSGVALINYFNNRSYKQRLMTDDEYNKFFRRKNWDVLNLDEQLVFYRDVLFMVSY